MERFHKRTQKHHIALRVDSAYFHDTCSFDCGYAQLDQTAQKIAPNHLFLAVRDQLDCNRHGFAAMFNITGSFIGTEGEIVYTAGIMNNIIEAFGGTRINWINAGSSYWANMTVMVVYIVWNALPFKILVLLGGLQSINNQYYDAAKVDGTSKGRVLRKITVPLLSPMIAYVVITGFIGGFKEYSSVVGIFGEKWDLSAMRAD